jgi:hypothetical protein
MFVLTAFVQPHVVATERGRGHGRWLTVGMRFRPHPLVRFGILLPTGMIPVAILANWSSAYSWSDSVGAAVAVLICALIAGRWILFAGAVCSDSHLRVRGLLWSRRIRRDAILSLSTDYVFVRWRNRWGRVVYSPMSPFWSEPNALWFVSEYNHGVLQTISDWVQSSPGYVIERTSSGRH